MPRQCHPRVNLNNWQTQSSESESANLSTICLHGRVHVLGLVLLESLKTIAMTGSVAELVDAPDLKSAHSSFIHTCTASA